MDKKQAEEIEEIIKVLWQQRDKLFCQRQINVDFYTASAYIKDAIEILERELSFL